MKLLFWRLAWLGLCQVVLVSENGGGGGIGSSNAVEFFIVFNVVKQVIYRHAVF